MRKLIVVCAMAVSIAVMSFKGNLSAQTTEAVSSADSTSSTSGNSNLAVYESSAQSIVVTINGQDETVLVYSNRTPNAPQNASFFYTRIPVLVFDKEYFDPELKSINFRIQLQTLSPENESKLMEKIASTFNIEKNGFQLTPLQLYGYTVRLIAENERATIEMQKGIWPRDYIEISGKIDNEYILKRLADNPNTVKVGFDLYYRFQVVRVDEIVAGISTSLRDRTIEEVLGRKPQTDILYVSRSVRQELENNITTQVYAVFPPNPSANLLKQYDELKNFLEQLPAITQNELYNVTAENLYFLPKQFQQEIEPTVIKNLIDSINENETFHTLLEKSWDELHTIAKESDDYVKFYTETQKRINSGGSSSGSFGLGSLLSIGASGSFNFNGEWNTKKEDEKRAIEKFYDDVRNKGTFKEELFRQVSRAITGKMEYSEVQAKDFELHRISLTTLLRKMEVCLSEIEKFPPTDMPFSDAIRIQDSQKMPPFVHPGTISAYMGKTAPDGWLMCDGKAIPSGDQYDALRTVLGNANTPDLRGVFLRGLDSGRGTDANRVLGSLQTDAFRVHRHTATVSGNGEHNHNPAGNNNGGSLVRQRGNDRSGSGIRSSSNINSNEIFWEKVFGTQGGTHTHSVAIADNGGTETRPINVAVNYIIKY